MAMLTRCWLDCMSNGDISSNLLPMFPSMQVLQRLHESPNVLQAIRAVFIAKASFLILRSGMPCTEAVTVKPAYMSSDQQKALHSTSFVSALM